MIESMAQDGMIYLDNNATTRVHPAVAQEMMLFLTENYGNPSSGYRFAKLARTAVDTARSRVAALLGCDKSEIVFTSGGTESNNAAINAAIECEPRGKHIVISAVEHSAVLHIAQDLAKRGCEVTLLAVDRNGKVDLAELENAIRPKTTLVSVMWGNNETGVLSPIEKIAELCRSRGIPFHSDAVQAAGKVPIRLHENAINFLSVSAHKFHGPKGVGALYVAGKTRFKPFVIGGSQEEGRRAGTENVASIVGMGKAAEAALDNLVEENAAVRSMRDRFERSIGDRISGVSINGAGSDRLPNTSNISFAGVDSAGVLLLLDRQGICCSAGSACRTGSHDGSHVLRAMQVPEELIRGSVRFSFGRYNKEPEVDVAIERATQVIGKLRDLGVPKGAVPARVG